MPRAGALALCAWLAATGAAAAGPTASPSPPQSPGATLGSWATLGQPERAATAAWWSLSRAWVLHDRIDPEVLSPWIHRIGQLDPTWRTPWVVGGLMLQTQGDRAAAAELLATASGRFPDDPWFPAARGVVLRDDGQLDESREWLERARALR